MNPSAPPAPRHRFLPLAALLIGNAALALGPWLVRLADTGPVSAGFWRLTLALPFLLLLARREGPPAVPMTRAMMLTVIAGGVFFALDLAAWHVGIGYTRLGNAALFGNSGSVILMIWGFIAWRRWPRPKEGLAIFAALTGAAILLGRSFEVSAQTLQGDLFCLLAGLFYAGYLIILKDARRGLGSWRLLSWATAAGVPVLLAAALLAGEPVWPQSWGPVVALAFSSQLVGQGLLVYAMRHFTPLAIGLALLSQPAIAALAGWLAFGETLGAIDVAGMLLLGMALVIARVARESTPAAPAVNPVLTSGRRDE
ncbi:EamA family transporter [Altererythrobacter soli]|uniref:EamA family transporter n=1 Tax=Croceibacterium soli TaxID=1739690 RepID=A0A6I4USU0_9SPHN|nr:DMT family transporter [Croceibacterium soli]MXP41831.1 EamA family transporter [Croceibacterium soli]